MNNWDYDIDHEDYACPKCGEYEDDPINYAPGEAYTICRECWGTGIVRWCSKCGFDLTAAEAKKHAADGDE